MSISCEEEGASPKAELAEPGAYLIHMGVQCLIGGVTWVATGLWWEVVVNSLWALCFEVLFFWSFQWSLSPPPQLPLPVLPAVTNPNHPTPPNRKRTGASCAARRLALQVRNIVSYSVRPQSRRLWLMCLSMIEYRIHCAEVIWPGSISVTDSLCLFALSGFDCRCGNLFCGLHRYSDKHNCPYDYKADAAAKIRKENPVVVADKIQRI